MSTTLADVVPVTPFSSHIYSIDLHHDWCIGSVPNGGYITALFLLVARTHLSTTHARRSAHHPINLHLAFLNKTSASPAVFTVRDIKLGSRISNIHIVLSQQDDKGESRNRVDGYITMSNFASETGLSLSTGYKPCPALIPIDLPACLSADEDDKWVLQRALSFPKFRRATRNIRIYLPKLESRPSDHPAGLLDQWVRFFPDDKPGKWTNDSIGFAVDMFPQIVEKILDSQSGEQPQTPCDRQVRPTARYWYPTLALNLDIKKLLPAEGVEWLFVRVISKVVKNGRFDMEIIVMDAEGDVVATSSHASLILGVERNTKPQGMASKL